jgi:hypothetical protein
LVEQSAGDRCFGQRKKIMRLELRKSFAQIDEMRDLEPNNFTELHAPKSFAKANKKNQAHNTVDKAQLARLDTGRTALDAYVQRMDRFGSPKKRNAKPSSWAGRHLHGLKKCFIVMLPTSL